ncbi:hypothetical protein [Nostoc sp. CHAB 5715]|uniref:hypothetical protein n=1 Tax=Nostoc sp. CHAB 5715 TaxID=2780400 RepID=UPI001E5CAE60|nr:hypothetical protein [Nostoc sp. CHAB 5715]MCC5619961.1 hypothetical protein [Nostoc sp. CHAB 5715]
MLRESGGVSSPMNTKQLYPAGSMNQKEVLVVRFRDSFVLDPDGHNIEAVCHYPE